MIRPDSALMAYIADAAKACAGGSLLVRGRRLDGTGRFTQRFTPITYDA